MVKLNHFCGFFIFLIKLNFRNIMQTQTIKLGVVGCGNMAQALIKGYLIKAQSESLNLDIEHLSLLSKSGIRAKEFAIELTAELNVKSTVADNLAELVEQSDVLLLAVKPQQINDVLGEVAQIIEGLPDKVAKDYLLISVAAGITLAALEVPFSGSLGDDSAVRAIRVMPNTPSLVGAGMAGYSLNSAAFDADQLVVDCLLSSVGCAVQVEEELLDPLTAVSGSGPAYVFRMLESMVAAGESAGLPTELAQKLSLHTFYGALQQ